MLAPEAVRALVKPQETEKDPGPEFTPRERDVLALLVVGLTNAEIGHRLGTSPSTAKVHVSNILGKMCVSSRQEAIAEAIKLGLVE